MIFLAKQREQEKLLLLSLKSLRTRLSSMDTSADTLLRKETAPGRMGGPHPAGQIWMN